jgi:hypothetical protein
MARFNTTPAKRNQVQGGSAFPARGTSSQQTTTVNNEGRTAWKLDEKTELYLGATSAFAGQDTFYEKGAKRDERLIALVRHLAVEDWVWTTDFLVWLRSEGNMRTMPIMLAVEAVRARLASGACGHGYAGTRVVPPGSNQVSVSNRKLIDLVLQRADEPGEMLAYCENVHGRMTPIAIRRGIGDAAVRLYNERNVLRYNSDSRALSFGSVIELAQPPQTHGWQSDLFGYLIKAQHNNVEAIPESLRAIRARDAANKMPVAQRHAYAQLALRNPDHALHTAIAGQWEWAHSWLGDTTGVAKPLTKKEKWELVAGQLGIFAALRNLRNLDEAGFKTGDKIVTDICARLASEQQIRRSRILPFRFFTAFQQLKSVTWSAALEQAANLSLSNIPELPGRTLVLVDTSGSMESKLSEKSVMSYAEAGALFGTALKIKNPELVNLWGFASGQFEAKADRGHSLLRCAEDFSTQVGAVGHGTEMAAAVRATYDKHDRVIIISDMQAFPTGRSYGARDVADAVPQHIPVYGFNLAASGTTPLGSGNRHSLGGLQDSTFNQILQLEKMGRGSWPWES